MDRDTTDAQVEKKSERMEIRLGHLEKQGFIEACHTQGDTPSEALRRFIEGYTRRANSDLRASAFRELRQSGLLSGWRFPTAIGSVAAALFLLFAASLPSRSVIIGASVEGEAKTLAQDTAEETLSDPILLDNLDEPPLF